MKQKLHSKRGFLTVPKNRIVFVDKLRIMYRNGRLAMNSAGNAGRPERAYIKAVAAAASVPSSLTLMYALCTTESSAIPDSVGGSRYVILT